MTSPLRDRERYEYERRSRRLPVERDEAAEEDTVIVHGPGSATTEHRSMRRGDAMISADAGIGLATSRTYVRDIAAERRRSASQITQVLWYLIGIAEALLLLRFVLKALGANPAAAFTQMVNGISNALIAPFIGIFPAVVVEQFELEPAALVAMLVYFLMGLGVARLVWILYGEPREIA